MEVRAKSLLPLDWAKMKSLEAAAYRQLQSGDRDENLRHSIAAYGEAAEIVSPKIAPQEYVDLQREQGDAGKQAPKAGV